MKTVQIGGVEIANNKPFALIAGPCVIESREHLRGVAAEMISICKKLEIPLIFKSSFDKANRTSVSGVRGMGMEQGLTLLKEIRDEFAVPVLTDVHEPWHCAEAAKYVDVLQIPAFLSRQTDLLIAAGETRKAINVKKGQFLAPWDMAQVAKKIASTGNENIMLCERGASFGYNTLVSDFRSLPIMAETGYPVIFDATHSVQQPGGQGSSSGGDRRFVPPLARAALAVGCAGLFIETHPDPDNAPSDGPNMVPLAQMQELLGQLKQLDNLTKSFA